MRTVILTILTVILVECGAFGQTILPSVYEIKTDTAYEQKISIAYYQMLEDKDGKLTIQDVTSLPQLNQFHRRNEKSGTRDPLSNIYWFRYRLRNSMDREAKIALNSMSEYDDFYLAEPGGNWKHYVSGEYIEWAKKDGLKYYNCIPIVMQPGAESIIYQRIKNDKVGLASGFDISILGSERMIKKEKSLESEVYFGTIHLQEAFVVGFLFLAMFFNLFFFRIVREKVYLYFALFVLFLCINRLYNIANDFYMVENAEWLRYVHLIGYAWAFIAYYLIQFFRQFFRTKERSPHWDRWLIGLAVMNLILFFVHFISELYFNDWARFLSRTNNIVVFLLVPLSIIITFLLFTRDKDKSVRFVIIGSFPLMLFYFLFTFINLVDFFSKTTEHSPLYETFFSHFRIREIIFVVWMVLSFSWILFMRYDRLIKENALIALDKERLAKEKEIERNELIELQKTELEKQVAARTTDLKHSLEDLKSTQAQLIQSEKMASLGELTAGIAHEIQNPLNFVNNFSEVNTELIEEMKTELRAGNQEEAIALANDIAENEKKINLHGKRADSIVKGMLQHSRSSSGVKELTDINALADEFLRLSYHGLRAKDKSFNAGLKTDFDPSVGKIKIVTEEIGRVILNLLNNAFYAVSEKKRLNPEGYEPTVSIGTKLVSDQIEIKVSDNGNGIPQRVLDKIFQPFFTTKPAGQGTGLGLSLSYDIVTKGHDGKLVAETKEGEGSTFYIYLPYKS